MARREGGGEPVSEEDFEKMSERIAEHFDRMRELMEQELEEQR